MPEYRPTLDDKLQEPEKHIAASGCLGKIIWIILIIVAACLLIPVFGIGGIVVVAIMVRIFFKAVELEDQSMRS